MLPTTDAATGSRTPPGARFAVGLVLAGSLLAALGGVASSPAIGIFGRWALVAGLMLLAAGRRSLTAWILVAMVAGAEIGHDWPAFAISLRLLSQIFLRLIKTILAPLIFATIVVGIAGHPNLKQVGRMGAKALLYFEVVTTLALVIGLVAINLTEAGVGVMSRRADRVGDPRRRRRVWPRRSSTSSPRTWRSRWPRGRCSRSSSSASSSASLSPSSRKSVADPSSRSPRGSPRRCSSSPVS